MIYENDIKESNKNLKKLCVLINENPELPVFPIVDESICDSVEFNVIFNLCKFDKPYIMKYCYYELYSDELKMYTEWSAVRRHIVGGENRTLISVNTPLRLCRIGTCRRFLAR